MSNPDAKGKKVGCSLLTIPSDKDLFHKKKPRPTTVA